MSCQACNTPNDSDARFCSECGKLLPEQTHREPAKARKGYFFILLLLPVIAAAAGIGYYKFFLPEGISAVVNGEEIKRSELDAAVARSTGGEAATGMLRHQVLSRLVTERIMLQEARKADITVSKEEVAAASAETRVSSGLDEDSFEKQMASQYGSAKEFERALERKLLINKFMASKIVPPGADPQAADRAVSRWFDGVSDGAAVRIALAEQGAGPGCGCSGSQDQATVGPRQGMAGCRVAAAQPASDQKGAAIEAALQYWRAKHGPETVTARAIDYGCHVQVDIIKDEKIIGSLRYQGGSILEQ